MTEAVEHKLTEAGSHTATRRGYACGVIVEEGEPVPAGIPVALESEHPEGWMAEAEEMEAPKPKAKKAAE